MKVMTFNTQHCLNYLERKIDFDVMANAIRACDPDIVGLNEMRGRGVDPEYTEQVKVLAEKTGMPYYYFARAIDFSGGGPYGNGFLSKIPIVRVQNIPIPDPVPHKYNDYYETRCVLKAVLSNGATVLVSHFGLNPDEAENAVATVVSNLEKEKCVFMGDLNLCPDDAILLPIRAKMKDTAECFGGEKLSFPSDAPRCKIDYIFVSPDVTVLSADIPAIVASDHRPHIAKIAF